MKLPRLHKIKLTRKKTILTSATLLLLLLGAGAAWFFVFKSEGREQILYAALQYDMDHTLGSHITEESIGTVGAEARSEGNVSKDGEGKSILSLTCTGSSSQGDVAVSLTFLQIQKDMYFHYDSVSFSGGSDQELNTQLNDFYKDKVNGKWIMMDTKYDQAASYQEQGVTFSLGAVSKKLSSDEIIDQMKKLHVVTILDSREIDQDGKPAIEYSLLFRRSTYESFMDHVEPRYRYKTQTLDLMFQDDTEEVSLVVDKKTKKPLYVQYSMPNPCLTYISTLDPEATKDLPTRLEIKQRNTTKETTDKLAKPASYISEDEFNQLFATEE